MGRRGVDGMTFPLQVVVASDAMTRGMDLPNVTAVVNYDTPVYAKTYVHRAGMQPPSLEKGSKGVSSQHDNADPSQGGRLGLAGEGRSTPS